MASSADDVVLVDEDIQESGTSISLTSNQSPPKKQQCIPSTSTASGFKSLFKRPPAKKKPKKYYNTFKKEWETDFHKDGILASKKGPDFAYCSLCQIDISIKSGGRTDLTNHVGRQKHKDEVSAIINKTSKAAHLGNFAFTSVADGKKGGKTGEEDNSVINAEVLFAQFIVEHNLPPTCADHAGKLFRSMFPDSDIAKRFKCARTKTTALVKHTADTDQKHLVNTLQTVPFSLSTDGSNDRGGTTLYPFVVRYYDERTGRVVTELLELEDINGASTGDYRYNLDKHIRS